MKQTSALCGRHHRCAAREGQGENYAIFFNGVYLGNKLLSVQLWLTKLYAVKNPSTGSGSKPTVNQTA